MGLFERIRDHRRKPSSGVAPVADKPAYPVEALEREHTRIRSSAAPTPNSVSSSSTIRRPLDPREQEDIDKKKAEEVARCSKLLRQMYSLDLRIWGMQSAIGKKEIQEREDLKQKANALFSEVNRVVNGWSATHDKWSPEEQRTVRNIHRVLNEHERQLY
jgi:hypothetical protein